MAILFCFLVGCVFLQTVSASIESDCLQKHNFYRSKHGAPALKYSTNLAEEAQKIAGALATQTDKEVTHGTYYANYFIAEWPAPRTISHAVENWYNQGNSYNYKQPEISKSNNRFIEILWKSHQRIGCGFAIDENHGVNVRSVVVAIYEPAGIRVDIDDYIENIMPPK